MKKQKVEYEAINDMDRDELMEFIGKDVDPTLSLAKLKAAAKGKHRALYDDDVGPAPAKPKQVKDDNVPGPSSVEKATPVAGAILPAGTDLASVIKAAVEAAVEPLKTKIDQLEKDQPKDKRDKTPPQISTHFLDTRSVKFDHESGEWDWSKAAVLVWTKELAGRTIKKGSHLVPSSANGGMYFVKAAKANRPQPYSPKYNFKGMILCDLYGRTVSHMAPDLPVGIPWKPKRAPRPIPVAYVE